MLQGKTKCIVRMLLLCAPGVLALRHSQVTYETHKSELAFSKELLEAAAATGWRPSAFGPIDIKRSTDSNGPVEEFFAGSKFVWPGGRGSPSVAGVPTDITGRWPLFHVTPELPKGLLLDRATGLITGFSEEEAEGDWVMTVSNPAGESSLTLHLRILSPPSDYTYDYVEAVLIRLQDIGANTCFVKGSLPLRYMAHSGLPKGLCIDEETGTISGIPDQLDMDFVTCQMLVCNDVGQTCCKLRLLVSIPPPDDDQDTGISIINKEVEARVGQRVQAGPHYMPTSRSLCIVCHDSFIHVE